MKTQILKIRNLLIASLLAASVSAIAAPPPPAATVLQDAQARARASHRNVMLIYHASWCGWCHKLDDALKEPAVAAVMDKAYVIVHVDVLEQGDKKSLENAGGAEQMANFGADDKTGIPFFVFITPDSKVLGTSIKPRSGNIGYPGEPGEIDYFMTLINRSAPEMSAGDRTKLEAFFRAAGAKLHGQQR
jgi:hypothetical protein